MLRTRRKLFRFTVFSCLALLVFPRVLCADPFGNPEQDFCQRVGLALAGVSATRADQKLTDEYLTRLLMKATNVDVTTDGFVHLNVGNREDKGLNNHGVFVVERKDLPGQRVVLKFAVQTNGMNPLNLKGHAPRDALPAVLTHERVRDVLVIHDLLGELGYAPRLIGLIPPAELVAIAKAINQRAIAAKQEPPIDLAKLTPEVLGVVMDEIPGAWNITRLRHPKQSFLKDVSEMDITAAVAKMLRLSHLLHLAGIDPRDLQLFVANLGRGKIDVVVGDVDMFSFIKDPTVPKGGAKDINYDIIESIVTLGAQWELAAVGRKFPWDKLPFPVTEANIVEVRRILDAQKFDLVPWDKVLNRIKDDAKTLYRVEFEIAIYRSSLDTSTTRISALQGKLRKGDRMKTWDEMDATEKDGYRDAIRTITMDIAMGQDALLGAEAWLEKNADRTPAERSRRKEVEKRVTEIKESLAKAQRLVPWARYLETLEVTEAHVDQLTRQTKDVAGMAAGPARDRRAKMLRDQIVLAGGVRTNFDKAVSDPEQMMREQKFTREERELFRQTAIPLTRAQILRVQGKLGQLYKDLEALGFTVD